MKTAIVAMSVSLIVASIFTLASSPVKQGVVEIKPKENVKSYAMQTSSAWCPVVGDGKSATEANALVSRDENGVEIYQHCEDCRAGVITAHDDGTSRCTFCGKQSTNN